MKLDNPADVAKDGYEALMNGEKKVISRFKNKMQATMSSVVSEETEAASFAKRWQKAMWRNSGKDRRTL